MDDESCGICGKDLKIGEKLYVTGGATLEEDTFCGGVMIDTQDEEFYTKACTKCGEKISDAICKLMTEA